MRSLSLVLLILPLCLSLTASVTAQNYSGAMQQVVNEFDRVAPKIGDPLPDLQAFDSSGNPFQLGQLKDNVTVLIFGCLT